MKKQIRGAAAALVMVAALAGCNESEDGAFDNVRFTPDDCGRVGTGCDFDDGLGAGGSVAVQVSGIDGFSTAGVDLASGTPDLLTVNRISDIGGAPAWELTGLAVGRARIEALQDGAEVDFLTVQVKSVVDLGVTAVLGEVAGGAGNGELDAVYTVTADAPVSFAAQPLDDSGLVTMGRFLYEIEIDETLEILDGSDAEGGYLYFRAPAGDHEVTFRLVAEPDIQVTALIQAEPGPTP
jgi:hypothetical protein